MRLLTWIASLLIGVEASELRMWLKWKEESKVVVPLYVVEELIKEDESVQLPKYVSGGIW